MRRALWILAVLLSHWWRHKMQLATLLIGLIAATALWSGVQAINQQARAAYDQAANVLGPRGSAMLAAVDGGRFPQSLFITLRRQGWAVSPALEGRVEIEGRSLRLIGIEPVTLPPGSGTSQLNPDDLARFLGPPGQMRAAPETMARLRLQPGDSAHARNGAALPPLTPDPQLAPGVLVVDIGIAQRLLNAKEELSHLVVTDRLEDLQQARSSLEAAVGPRLAIVAADSSTELEQLTDSFHLNLTAFGLLSFLVGLFIVHSAAGLAFEQRRPMLRVLRACGASSRMLNAVLAFELVALALAAGLVGLVAGYFIAGLLLADVAATLNGLYGAELPGELVLRPQWWLSGMAISILGALAAASSSMIKAFSLPLLNAAQPHAWHQAQRRWLRIQSGFALGAFAVMIALARYGQTLDAGFGVVAALMLGAALLLPVVLEALLRLCGGLARRPLSSWFWADCRQQLRALSLALSALLLALAVNVGVATMVETFSRTFSTWLDGRLACDVYVTATSDSQALDIVRFLSQNSGVEAVLPSGHGQTRIAGQTVELLGLPDHPRYRSRWPLLAQKGDPWSELASGDGAFISEQLGQRLKLDVGDRLAVPTPDGDWWVTIVGRHADYGNPRGQIAVNTAALARHFPGSAHNRVGILVGPEQKGRLIKDLRQAFALNETTVTDQASVRDEALQIFHRTFAVTSALNGLTLAVAAIALLTSLLTLANSRLPQLAPLWAIGITRRQLAAIELLRTLALALFTAMLALPVGLLVAWCLVAIVNVKAFGWRLPFHVFPVQLLTLIAVTLLAAMAAALIPVTRLARMHPATLVKVFANER